VGKQAFLVDDSKSARIVLGRLLKKNGFDEVEMAESGEQAIEQLKNLNPDAIFVDFLMDGMDGLETISQIKKDGRFNQTPIVMCTANEGERYVQAAVEHGALGILAKPPTDESLKAIIELIEQQEQQPEALTVANDESVPDTSGTSEDMIRRIAIDAARQATKSAAAEIARETAESIATEAASNTVKQMLEPLVASLVAKRMQAIKPPKVDTEALRSRVVSQVNEDLEEYVRQINQRTVEGLIEARIYEQIHDMANDFSQRLDSLKQEILVQVPEKNDMIEHIRVVTEGSMEAQVREIATQISQEMANSVATETVENLLDQHLAEQSRRKAENQARRRKGNGLAYWLGLPLAGAALGMIGYLILLVY
jgi:CheY-like chemotaxis protein